MRKETSNQFTEGLVGDLNPITTPNTVLTDNLNGTIITYNGNEFSLQNDQGNYELKHCRLKPNYIPVGIKEHGDILYIVSYNPLDKHVEIGSYPSPLMITTPKEEDSPNTEIKSIIKSQILDVGKTEELYSTLMENVDNIIFNGDNFKLNPGDMYCIQIEDRSQMYKYETIDYNILDEESISHNITNLIEIDNDGGIEDFKYIKWTIPGWMMINARLAELSVAGINIRHFYISNGIVNFSFNLRLNVKDELLINNGILQEWCSKISNKNSLNDIKFRIKISSGDKTFIETDCSINDYSRKKDLWLKESGWNEWYGDSRIIWKNIEGSINIGESDKIVVQMIPVLNEQIDNNEYQIVYDNLKQEIIFDLKSVDDVDWNVGTSLYQFTTSENSIKIYTDIVGPKVSGAPIALCYEIYDLNEQLVKEGKFNDYYGIGENVLYINYDDNFKKENIYVIRFKFVSNETVYNTIDRFLITSVLFNEFTDRDQFDRDISFNEWISKYWTNISNIALNEQDFEFVSKSEFDWETEKTNRDKIYFSEHQFNTFHPYPHSGLSELRKLKKGYEHTYNLLNRPDPELLSGDLWNSLSPNINLKYQDAKTEELVDIEDSVKVYKFLEKQLKYSEYGTPFKFANVSINTFDKEKDYVCDLFIKMVGKNDSDDREFGYYMEFKTGDVVIESIDYKSIASNNSEGSIVDVSGHIQTFLIKNNINFIRLNVHFSEKNSLKKWNLSNRFISDKTWLGFWNCDHHVPDFVFNGLDDSSKTLSFIAFKCLREIDFDSNELTFGHVTLLPLTDKDSESMYYRFVESLFYIEENVSFSSYIRYNLINSSWNDIESILKIYGSGNFSKNKYLNINVLSSSEKSDILSKWKKLKIQYDDVFVNGEYKDVVHELLDIAFNLTLDNTLYPYVDSTYKSIYNIDIELNNYTMSIEDSYNKWEGLFEYISRRENTRGIYCKNTSDLDAVIYDLNKNYQNNFSFYLSPYSIEDLEEIGIKRLKLIWAAGRTSNRDMRTESLDASKGLCFYGSVFKNYNLVLEYKWSWLNEI